MEDTVQQLFFGTVGIPRRALPAVVSAAHGPAAEGARGAGSASYASQVRKCQTLAPSEWQRNSLRKALTLYSTKS